MTWQVFFLLSRCSGAVVLCCGCNIVRMDVLSTEVFVWSTLTSLMRWVRDPFGSALRTAWRCSWWRPSPCRPVRWGGCCCCSRDGHQEALYRRRIREAWGQRQETRRSWRCRRLTWYALGWRRVAPGCGPSPPLWRSWVPWCRQDIWLASPDQSKICQKKWKFISNYDSICSQSKAWRYSFIIYL